jgi:hypothetical protein
MMCVRCHKRPRLSRRRICKRCKNRAWNRNRPTYQELSPERRRRHIAVAYAGVYFRSGRLKPKPCERRRSGRCRGPIEKHHVDYSKPLLVSWICRGHHREKHAQAA